MIKKDLYFSKKHKELINHFDNENTETYKYVRVRGIELEFTIEAEEGSKVAYSFDDLVFIGTFDEDKIFRTNKVKNDE